MTVPREIFVEKKKPYKIVVATSSFGNDGLKNKSHDIMTSPFLAVRLVLSLLTKAVPCGARITGHDIQSWVSDFILPREHACHPMVT